MMKINVKAFLFGIVMALAIAAITYAYTQDQIWSNVYDSVAQAIRVTQV